MARRGEYFARRALLDDAPSVHHGNAITDVPNHTEVAVRTLQQTWRDLGSNRANISADCYGDG